VFILGAGASKFANYPLAPELWAFVRDHSGGDHTTNQIRQRVISLMEKMIARWLPPDQQDRPNLEEILTYMDLASMGSALIQLGHTDWKNTRLELMRMISHAFQWYQYKLQPTLETDSKLGAVLKAWTSFLQKGDVIITFNWDLLHEAALLKAGKWHYSDGYGFGCNDAPSNTTSPIRILKLHGSVNWAQSHESDCQPSIEHKADFFLGSFDDHEKTYSKRAGQSNEGRYLVIPSYLKDTSSNRLILDLWNQAQDAVAQADQLIVIGYSLHPADAPSRQLFGSALLRNKKISRVFCVRPDGGIDHWDGFCNAVGKYRKPIRNTFEDWVKDPVIPN
jgi:hypothetical protein